MNENTYPHGLSYDLITRAAHGDEKALVEILRVYEPFHNSLCTREVLGSDGRIRKEVDEDKKIQVQMHLVEAIREKWRELI